MDFGNNQKPTRAYLLANKIAQYLQTHVVDSDQEPRLKTNHMDYNDDGSTLHYEDSIVKITIKEKAK